MSGITIPKYVRKALVTLQARGHLAYLVGGCVRDMLLGRQPNDWDICTSALPRQVMELFRSSEPSGIQHGTVTVYINSHGVEVTTFRSESAYTDHRHPDAVSFVGDLNTDLARRDFTMNAIALPADGLIVDPFGGVEDIARRQVRCVGEPLRRFDEDALRMFRALRFAARLDFVIEEKTGAAMREKAHLASCLTAERIREELEKTLLTHRPQTVFTALDAGLLDDYTLSRDAAPAAFESLEKLPRKALERWTGLGILLEDFGCVDSAESFLQKLCQDSRTVRCGGQAASLIKNGLPEADIQLKKLLNLCGVDTVLCAAACADALYGGHSLKSVKRILKSGECFSVKHLAIGGDELLELGLRGRQLGEMLDFLLDYVMEYPENNRRELLLALAQGTED